MHEFGGVSLLTFVLMNTNYRNVYTYGTNLICNMSFVTFGSFIIYLSLSFLINAMIKVILIHGLWWAIGCMYKKPETPCLVYTIRTLQPALSRVAFFIEPHSHNISGFIG